MEDLVFKRKSLFYTHTNEKIYMVNSILSLHVSPEKEATLKLLILQNELPTPLVLFGVSRLKMSAVFSVAKLITNVMLPSLLCCIF